MLNFKSLAAVAILLSNIKLALGQGAAWSQCTASVSTSTPATTTATTLVTSTTSAGGTTTSTPAGSGDSGYSTGGANSIDAKFRAKGKKYFGVATDQNRLTVGSNAAIIQADFGQVTPENSMKWDTTEGLQSRPSCSSESDFNPSFSKHVQLCGSGLLSQLGYYQSEADSRSHFVLQAGTLNYRLGFRILPQRRPSPLFFRTTLQLKWDVTRERYMPGVVNEIFNEDGSMRTSVWYNVLGENFVSIAFAAAKTADPNAKLYINDYNLDSATYAKVTTGMVAHVKKWIAAGVPIEGIGSQSHLSAGQSSATAGALAALAASGVGEVAVTELDITNAAASDYVAVTNACLNLAKCVGITVWGVRDPDSWRASNNPLLFDA
ncbi:related to endo-beta-1,4-D-xylanase [Phialocephala subalpina]|uniref:Beta-xylanase n=1 Tax=Phialocephala subalpina TaxID=576137 RepID=A0A1L7X4T7_9HELO|nr:related to endo-beta-1,4-D-xylanase [Phialocephala subalpina]